MISFETLMPISYPGKQPQWNNPVYTGNLIYNETYSPVTGPVKPRILHFVQDRDPSQNSATFAAAV